MLNRPKPIPIDDTDEAMGWLHSAEVEEALKKEPVSEKPLTVSVATSEGIVVAKFNPFHDKSGRFASAPWSSVHVEDIDKEFGPRIKKEVGAADKAANALLKSPGDVVAKNAFYNVAKDLQNTRIEYLQRLGLKWGEMQRAENMVETWGKGKMLNGTLLKGVESGTDRSLGGAAAWSQSVLKAQGVSQVTLYRGVYGPQAESLVAVSRGAVQQHVDARSISSWTSDKGTATRFAKGEFMMPGTVPGKGAVLTRTVPASQVLIHHKAFPDKFDYMFEKEYVVAGDGFQMPSAGISAVQP